MAKKITALAAAALIEGVDLLAIVDMTDTTTKKATIAQILALLGIQAGDGVRVTGTSPGPYTVHGVGKSCSPETFGAVGDDSTDDTVALQAMLDALEAGTYTHAELGAKTYLVSGQLLFNAAAKLSIRGQGPVSRIHATNAVTGAVLLVRNATDVHLTDFEIYGNATFSSVGVNTAAGGGTGQNGVEIGYLGGDGTSRLQVSRMSFHNLGGRGLSFAYGPDIRGPSINAVSVYECLVGMYPLDACTITNFQAWKCGTAIHNAGSGNMFLGGFDIVNCSTGIRYGAGSNGGHGAIVDGTVRHCGTHNIRFEAVVNGVIVAGVTIYEAALTFDGGNDEVIFSHCLIDAQTYTLAGKALFDDCRFDQSYFGSASVTGGVRFVQCRDIDGSVPTFIGDAARKTFTYPGGDASQTLSTQDAVAATLVLPAGTFTASRQITNPLAPNKTNTQLVKNASGQTITYKWATGTTVSLATGLSAIIGADGTNATLELSEAAGGGGEANTMSSSGGTASIVQTKAGVNLPVRGFSATSPIGVTQNTNDLTFSMVGGTNGQFARWASGAAGWGNDASFIDLGGGTVYSASAKIRLPYAATDTIIGVKDSVGTDRKLWERTAADSYTQGAGGTAFTGWYDWGQLNLWGRVNANLYSGAGGSTTWVADGTNFKIALPVCGLAAESKPFRWKHAAVSVTTSGQTLTAAQYECPFITFTSTIGSSTPDVVFPNQEGAFFCIENNATAEIMKIVIVAAGAGPTVGITTNGIVIHNGTRYIQMSANVAD